MLPEISITYSRPANIGSQHDKFTGYLQGLPSSLIRPRLSAERNVIKVLSVEK